MDRRSFRRRVAVRASAFVACGWLATIASTSACSTSDAGGAATPDTAYRSLFHQPLDLRSDRVTGQLSAADPHAIRVGDRWYLYPTTSSDAFEAWWSDDLVTWTYGGVIWQPDAASWNAITPTIGGAWAPSVHPGPGGYYLYYTGGMRVGVAFSESPLGPFHDVLDHPLLGNGYGGVGTLSPDADHASSPSELAIDAFLLETSKGDLFLYASIYVPGPALAVWPMSDHTTLAATSPTIVLRPDTTSWESFITEGPFVVEIDGTFLLTYSGNVYTTPSYALGAATSASPLGPFTKDPTNPFWKRVDDRGIWGPGHHSFVPGPSGETLIFYHAKASVAAGPERRVRFAEAELTAGGARVVLDDPQP